MFKRLGVCQQVTLLNYLEIDLSLSRFACRSAKHSYSNPYCQSLQSHQILTTNLPYRAVIDARLSTLSK